MRACEERQPERCLQSLDMAPHRRLRCAESPRCARQTALPKNSEEGAVQVPTDLFSHTKTYSGSTSLRNFRLPWPGASSAHRNGGSHDPACFVFAHRTRPRHHRRPRPCARCCPSRSRLHHSRLVARSRKSHRLSPAALCRRLAPRRCPGPRRGAPCRGRHGHHRTRSQSARLR